MPPSNLPENTSATISSRWMYGVWLVVFGLTAWLEGRRFVSALETPLGAVSWLTFWDIETTLPFVVLLALPVLVLSSGARRQGVAAVFAPVKLPIILISSVVIFTVSLLSSWRIGAEPIIVPGQVQNTAVAFADLPPAYHDEYSYLLQAQTFGQMRLSYPGMTVRPDLFHQMHVLNEYRTISRYFPWTGIWMTPFVASGHAIWGHWVAGALAAMFFYLAMLQIVKPWAAFAGGLLIAVSPGIAVFSNLLLAHHPTMLALSIFTFAFFRMMSTNRLRYAFVAGTGLTLAMLGRPMTAAGFALPFGVWLLYHIVLQRNFRLAIGFVIPLALGFVALGVLNKEATGSVLRSGYQEYTDTFTPSHRYGFNNAAQTIQDDRKVVEAYDAWATNLTPAVAAQNVWNRLFYSVQWSLAIFPLLFGILMAIPVICGNESSQSITAGSDGVRGLRLLALSFLTLHIVHVPYWYDGIMHWHYVFETAPILLLITGVGMTCVHGQLRMRLTQRTATCWVCCLLLAGLIPGWFALPAFDNTSKVSAAIGELSFSRGRLEFFRQTTDADAVRKPALVLIDERGTDPQLSYVVNDPELQSDVIICRRPATDEEIDELQHAFPDRTIYNFDPKSLTLTKWQIKAEDAAPRSGE